MPTSDRVRALAMVGLAAWCTCALLRRRRGGLDVAAAAALAALAAWWLFQSPAYEGPGILALTSTSGLAAADMGVPPSFFLSGAVLYAAWRDRRRRQAASQPEDVLPRS